MGLAYIGKSAVISPCGAYRTILERRWGPGPVLAWIGHNPSTADAAFDDPTIRREVAFSAREGYGALVKVNAMDLRATDPSELRLPGRTPVSPANASAIALACAGRDVLVATGTPHGSLSGHVAAAIEIAAAVARTMRCLGRNADGSGKHPLYVRGDAPLLEWAR